MQRNALLAATLVCVVAFAESASSAPSAIDWTRTNFNWSAETERQLARASDIRTEFAGILAALESGGSGAYARMRFETIDYALRSIAERDIPLGRSNRVARQAAELESFAPAALDRARRAVEGLPDAQEPAVPRFAGGPLMSSGPLLLGRRVWPDGRIEEQAPVSLVGWGHWESVTRDLPALKRMGFDFQQTEVRMRNVRPEPGAWREEALEPFLLAADAAAAQGTKVDFGLGLHYAPAWLVGEPGTAVCTNNFMRFCIHDEAIVAGLADFARDLAARTKDFPALAAFCLSNEPGSGDVSRCPAFRERWIGHLEAKFGSIDALNAAWGRSYRSFADVPVAAWPSVEKTPECLETIRCERAAMSDFHDRIAAAVREVAPDVPLHAKLVMDCALLRTDHKMFWSIDGERFARTMDWHDLDPVAFYAYGDTPAAEGLSAYANDWMRSEAACDYLRSFADKPLVDSENHNIVDDSMRRVPPEHIYSALWQEALHGLRATAVWTWERGRREKDEFNGLVPEHPDALEALGRCALDMQRLSGELASMQLRRPTVLVMSSLSAQVLGDLRFLSGYAGASFIGEPLGAITEETLARFAEDGQLRMPLDTARVVLLPAVSHMTPLAAEGLAKLEARGVKVLTFGAEPTLDDCGKLLAEGALWPTLGECDDKTIHAVIASRIDDLGLPERPRLVRPVFGVETHGVETCGRRLIALCNHLKQSASVELESAGIDLISGLPVGKTIDLPPLMPLLVELEP